MGCDGLCFTDLRQEDKSEWLVRVLRNPFPYLLTPQEISTNHGSSLISCVFTKLASRKSLFILAKPVASTAEATLQELYEKPFPFDRAKHAACFGDHDNHAANPDADHPLYRTEMMGRDSV